MATVKAAQAQEFTATALPVSEQREDLELVMAHKDGNPDAFHFLVKKNQQRVFSHCMRIVKDADECADLTQEVFIKVFLNLKKYEPSYAFKTWLYRITANCCIDFLRKKKRRRLEVSLTTDFRFDFAGVGSELEIADRKFCPERHLNSKQFNDILGEVIGKLSERLRDTFILKEMAGLSNKEIAEILDCPLNTVKTRMKNARERLKVLLGPDAKRYL